MSDNFKQKIVDFYIFSVSSTTARRIPCVILFLPDRDIGAIKKQESSNALLVYTQSRAGFPSWFRVPLTSLSTQNRLYSVNTSISV